MGLDIRAYSGLVKVRAFNEGDESGDYYDQGLRKFYPHIDFPASRFTPLEENMLYSYVSEYSFRAGSYSGYNEWREQLAALVGTTTDQVWAEPQPGPFMELINFADNEGTLGSEICEKLLHDFQGWNDRAKGGGTWFYDRYVHWMKAFELGADNGAVDFG
jgi:hypothetical protein